MPTDLRVLFNGTLTLHKPEEPGNIRFVEKRGNRYILQERMVAMSGSHTVSVHWRDVPLVKGVE